MNAASILVDPNRCFYEKEENVRLNLEGFGELAVTGASRINGNLNKLTLASWEADVPVIVTSEAHPDSPDDYWGDDVTAHFSPDPNFVDTWTKHGRDGTPGAMLHPELLVAQFPERAELFIKGDVVAASPAEDTSYTGALAHKRGETELLPDYLERRGIAALYVAGLALGNKEHPLCVDSTAIDFAKRGFDVTVLTDAVEAVFPENRAISFANMANHGIKLATTQEALEMIAAAHEA